MSAHFFTSLHPCLAQSGTYDGVESRGWSDTHSHCSAQFTTLITPNISIERPDAHLADGPTQDVAMANHRPYVRGFTRVFHYARCFIYTRTTGRYILQLRAAAWRRPGASNTNLGAAKYEFGGVYFAFFTANTAKYSPKYFRICEYGPYLAFLAAASAAPTSSSASPTSSSASSSSQCRKRL